MTTMNKQDAINILAEDRTLLIESLMQIQDKSRNLVPFKLKNIQRMMARERTGRDVYVKPAQVGASSWFVADYLLDCLTINGTVANIISYDENITSRLLKKAQIFYDFLKMRQPDLPDLEHKSASEKTFKGMHSSFYISSARSYAFGRGETIHKLLIDEYAFWPPGEPEKLVASAMQRVPLTTDTSIDILSTPNGEDNDFHEIYMAAKEGHHIGKSTYKAHFYPWWLHEEYVMEQDSPFTLPDDRKEILDNISPDEERVVRALNSMGVDEHEIMCRIRWRRYKQVEMASARRSGDTVLLFGQEYPEDDVSCFLAAGDMVYDSDLIMDLAKNCYPAPIHNMFADIWYAPEEGLKYMIAVDPGEGKISDSVATVWTFGEDWCKHHATLSGLYDQDRMAELTMPLADYYNGAIIALEDALDIVSSFKGYHDLYYRADPVSGKVSNSIGWHTNGSTKPYMLKEMKRLMYTWTCHDIRILSQCRNIRWSIDKTGRARGMPIGADDYHDSAAIAMVCKDSIPIERGYGGSTGWPDNWGR